MRVILDADCLIKITKAGIKEDICNAFDIAIPHLVKEEVIDRGKAKGLSDAVVVDKNIKDKLLKVTGEGDEKSNTGEKEAVNLFQKGGFDAIGSDDRKFIKQLRLFNIAYITPAVFVALLLKQGYLTQSEAMG
ncbi:MAG: hypothetical protein HZC45_00295, partial [Deltaproteobacteria bacterium]|nr:hypothetical protein [Deltaproteobacteria bacterium]